MAHAGMNKWSATAKNFWCKIRRLAMLYVVLIWVQIRKMSHQLTAERWRCMHLVHTIQHVKISCCSKLTSKFSQWITKLKIFLHIGYAKLFTNVLTDSGNEGCLLPIRWNIHHPKSAVVRFSSHHPPLFTRSWNKEEVLCYMARWNCWGGCCNRICNPS